MIDKNIEIYVYVQNKNTKKIYKDSFVDPEASLYLKINAGPIDDEFLNNLIKFKEDLEEFKSNLSPEDELVIITNI